MKDGWELKALGDVYGIVSGAGFPKKYQGKASGDFPFFKVGDMNNEGNEAKLLVANHYISETTRKELSARILPPGEAFTVRTGQKTIRKPAPQPKLGQCPLPYLIKGEWCQLMIAHTPGQRFSALLQKRVRR